MVNRRQFVTCLAGITVLAPLSRAHANGQATRKTGWFYSDQFLKHSIDAYHPESRQRLIAINRLMQASDIWGDLLQFRPEHDIYPHILQVHTQAHIDSVMKYHKRAGEVASAVVSAAITATDKVCDGQLDNAFCASRPPGHHALNTGREEGFCYFNAVAIAARYAQTIHQVEKILIIDWDYHHGNGTEFTFYEDPSVLFFSTHNLYAYPGTGHPGRVGAGRGKGYNINVHLDCSVTDAEIMATFQQELLPAVEKFKPQLILISAGFDSRTGDKLGCFDITDVGFQQLTRLVMDLAEQYNQGKIVSIMEGGYTPKGLASAVHSHVKTLLSS